MSLTVYEEHLFWIEILEDHAYFVRDHLSAAETKWIETARSYIQAFSSLREQLRGLNPSLTAGSEEMRRFAQQAAPVASGYYRFEGHLQRLRIANEVNLQLTPTYFNGTLSENAEYLRQLTFYVQGLEAEPLPLTSSLDIWLEDQIGHALLLRNVLDPVEQELSRMAEEFLRRFQGHQLKHVHIKGYLRFTPPLFPAHRNMLRGFGQTVIDFQRFVDDVVELHRRDEVLNRTTLRFLAHHYPETCYLLRRLAAVEPSLNPGPCSLTKPAWGYTP